MSQVGIDTNIFLHLFNPTENPDAHIDRLLGALAGNSYRLLVDSKNKIANEYKGRIVPMIRNMDETKPQLPLLRHWMSLEVRHEVRLDLQDTLMQRIRTVIVEVAEHADRAFVYVVCCADATLITNDGAHILNRRQRLLKQTRGLRGSNTDVQSSQDAAVRFCSNA